MRKGGEKEKVSVSVGLYVQCQTATAVSVQEISISCTQMHKQHPKVAGPERTFHAVL